MSKEPVMGFFLERDWTEMSHVYRSISPESIFLLPHSVTWTTNFPGTSFAFSMAILKTSFARVPASAVRAVTSSLKLLIPNSMSRVFPLQAANVSASSITISAASSSLKTTWFTKVPPLPLKLRRTTALPEDVGFSLPLTWASWYGPFIRTRLMTQFSSSSIVICAERSRRSTLCPSGVVSSILAPTSRLSASRGRVLPKFLYRIIRNELCPFFFLSSFFSLSLSSALPFLFLFFLRPSAIPVPMTAAPPPMISQGISVPFSRPLPSSSYPSPSSPISSEAMVVVS